MGFAHLGDEEEAMPEKLVEIKDLEISFGEGSKKFVAVHNANFFINKGETFSLVGESGSGKTTIGRAIIGLNDTSNGEIILTVRKSMGTYLTLRKRPYPSYSDDFPRPCG